MAVKRDYDYLFKMVIIGDSGVGKSALLLRECDEVFEDSYISTIGVDFRYRTVDVDGKCVKLQIWDTAGQDRFRTITSAYYRGANGVIVVYDITSKRSFENVNRWIKECTDRNPKMTIVLVGNKCDLEDKRAVPKNIAEQFAKEHNYFFVETSAKHNTNVNEAFIELTRKMLEYAAPAPKIPVDPIFPPQPHQNNKCCT